MGDFVKKNTTTLIIVLVTVVLAGIAVFTATRLYQLRQSSVAPNAPSSKPAAAGLNCSLNFKITLASPTPTPTPPVCGSTCTFDTDCLSGMTCLVTNGSTTGVCRNPLCTNVTNCICGSSTPTATPTATPTPTASPSPVPQCGTVCSTAADCPSSMTCTAGSCRNPSCTGATNCICTTSTPSPTPGAPNACGGTCGSDSNCASGMTCYITSGTSGLCRNPNCSTSTNCLCATASASPTTTPTLPNSGSIAPTILGIAAGAILLIAGIALVL